MNADLARGVWRERLRRYSPRQRAVLSTLAEDGPADVSELQRRVLLPQVALSTCLRALRGRGAVTFRKHGRRRIYEVQKEGQS